MRNKPTAEQLAKLPAWAQAHIRDIECERNIAVRELNQYMDTQTPAPFFIDSYVCTGEAEGGGPTSKRQYVQGHRMSVNWKGVHLDLHLTESDSAHWPGIQLSYSDSSLSGSHIALIPTSNQQMMLIAPQNMRVRPADPKCKHSLVKVKVCEECGWKTPL